MLNRRNFIGSLAGGAITANLLSSVSAKEKNDSLNKVESKIRVDSLCYNESGIDSDSIAHAIEGGLTAAVFDISIYPREYNAAVKELSSWNSLFRGSNSKVISVLKAADFGLALNERKLGIVLACQDATILGTSLGNWRVNLNLFYTLGLRVLQLTHNARTHWADSYQEKRDAGVSVAGEKLIQEMNRLGMIVDLSHCSQQTLLDAVQMSQKPCAVTHAGCKALAPTARNKTDEEIRAIGNAGGFFGVFNMTWWLTQKPTANLNTVIDHIEHVAQLISADKVGFGSDGALDKLNAASELAGMKSLQKQNAGGKSFEWEVNHLRVPELNAPNRLLVLAEGLNKRGFSDAQIDGITGGNFVKFFQKVCG